MLAGDFNDDLDVPEGNHRKEDITTAMETASLEDMIMHSPLGCKAWERDGRTWCLVQKGREVRSQMEYLLVMERPILHNVSVFDLCQKSDHYMVLG